MIAACEITHQATQLAPQSMLLLAISNKPDTSSMLLLRPGIVLDHESMLLLPSGIVLRD
jgi:hypothetical protein